MLGAYLRSLLGSDPAIDDLFQEVLMVAWRRMNDFDRARDFGAWLRGIARNLAMDHGRRRGARLAVERREVLDLLDARFDAVGARFSERTDGIVRCIAELPGPMREVVEMTYARGMMLKQISEALQVAEETVKKRIQRARSALAECMRRSGVIS
ncbi:MAG: sigma-70 family RNA polymerase sigma factor [Planctomycetes bacterium]|nr:sigma-70 family RNA polymerase sigma factor [Planctomycetota bacterium]